MTSLPAHFAFGTPSSSNVREALESYRRSQYFLSHSNVSNSDLSEDSSNSDPEACILPSELDHEDGIDTPDSDETVLPPNSLFEWDDEDCSTPMQRGPPLQAFTRHVYPTARHAREVAPLLRKSSSFSGPPSRSYSATSIGAAPIIHAVKKDTQLSTPIPAVKAATTQYDFGGKSTFGQTLFNSIAILLGIGMLSEPLAFAYAGWTCGTILIIFYGFLTCYTAKILAHFILSDSRLRTYADIGRKAFGARSTPIISFLFCLELFTVSVALVTLYADSLEAILPAYSANVYKVIGLAIFLPTVFLPLSVLSLSSVLGVLSSIALIAVILIDGLYKKEAPGSLWEPADTSFGIDSLTKLGVSFGLFMAGFAGHTVIPSLARDMKNPDQFDEMIDLAFIVSTFIYATIGIAGYCMFGNNVSAEFSQDLLSVPGYNAALNKVALWLLVISPLSKFGLLMRPLNATIEALLGLDNTPPPTSHEEPRSKAMKRRNETFKQAGVTIERTLLTLGAVGVSILIPEFSSMMGFLGSFSAFLLCVIGPISAKVAINGHCGKRDAAILFTATVMAVWGTFSVWYLE